MDPASRKKMEEMLRQQELEFKGLAKELNLGDDDDEDPEMKELNKALLKQGRNYNL